MAPKQVVAAGTITLRDGSLLPLSTFNSEVERLSAEADRGDPNWVNRRVTRSIPMLYGLVCWKCREPITIHWNGQPLARLLMNADQEGLTTHGHFHTECWEEYRRLKNNKSRRLRYAAAQWTAAVAAGGPLPAVPPPPAAELAALPAAPPPPAPAVLPAMEQPLPAPGVDNPLHAAAVEADEGHETEEGEEEEAEEEEEEDEEAEEEKE